MWQLIDSYDNLFVVVVSAPSNAVGKMVTAAAEMQRAKNLEPVQTLKNVIQLLIDFLELIGLFGI